MKASTKRITSIFGSILLLLGLLIFYSYFIRPAYEEVMAKRGEVLNKEKLVSDYEADLARIKEMTENYNKMIDLEKTLSTLVPSSENIPSSVMQLAGLAKINKITVRAMGAQIAALKPSKQPGLVKNTGTVRITLRAQGAYEDFKNFLRGIETNMNIMDVESVKIDSMPSSRTIPSGWLDYAIVIATHYEE